MKIGNPKHANEKLILPFLGKEAVKFDADGFAEIEDEIAEKIVEAVEDIFPEGYVPDANKKVAPPTDAVNWKELPEGLSQEVVDYIEKIKKMSPQALLQLASQMAEPPAGIESMTPVDLAQALIDVVVEVDLAKQPEDEIDETEEVVEDPVETTEKVEEAVVEEKEEEVVEEVKEAPADETTESETAGDDESAKAEESGAVTVEETDEGTEVVKEEDAKSNS